MGTAMQISGPQQDDPIATAACWLAGNRQVAIATVVRTWGSSPLPQGSQMVVDGEGNFSGSVSGGCIEGAVIEAALGLLASAPGSKLLRFGVTNQRAWEVGLSCGGEIEIFVETVAA